MLKVKTFASGLAIFHVAQQLHDLDEKVNTFIDENGISEVMSVSDTCTTDDTGKTIGIVRVLAYQVG